MLTPYMADPDTTVSGSEIFFQGPHCLRMTTGEQDVWHLCCCVQKCGAREEQMTQRVEVGRAPTSYE